MSTDFNETPGAPRYRKAGSDSKSVAELFKNPVVKMIAVVAVIGGVGMAALHFSNTHQTQEQSALPVVDTSQNQAPPDAEITPEYAQAIQDADAQRVAQARAEGDTAMPSIMDAPVMNPSVDPNATNQEDQDPLREFEALVKRNDEPEVPAPVAAPAGPQINPEAVMALSDAMRSQMETLMHNWDPVPMNVLTTEVRDADLQQNNSGLSNVSAQSDIQGKVIVPAGSVYYGQMLMEANSDIPGPIMAQILTGPFAGARAIGSFETFRNHLLIRFRSIVYKTKEYNADMLALNPDTTLGGVVTEVDPRYFQRAILPAAAAFVRAYGETLSEPSSTVTATGSDTVTTSTQEQDSQDALYAGIGEAADRVAEFVDEEASATKRLVRVAVGTPIGLFFVQSVREQLNSR